MTEICVIVCTFNRCEYLPKLIESLTNQTLSSESFEIVVVDNNSEDKTRETIARFESSVKNMRYVCEPEQGLSVARNRGVRETEATYVVFVDDDAYAEPRWLVSLLEAFGKDEGIVCVGGPVELDWQGSRPAWVPERYESLFTSVDHGSAERYLDAGEYLVGANIAFRRTWLMERGGFPRNLGRKGLSLLSGEEAAVYKDVFADGKRAFYHPGAKVRHRVTRERKTRTWFLRRLFWDGATQPILDFGTGQPSRTYWRGAWYDLRRCARFFLEATAAFLLLNHDACIDAFCRLDQRLGRLYVNLKLASGMIR